jgi:hypothetical protein
VALGEGYAFFFLTPVPLSQATQDFAQPRVLHQVSAISLAQPHLAIRLAA